jgi:hypothetical protein
VSVQVVVMAHPARSHMVRALADKVQGPVRVVWDPVPDEPGCWECAKRAWREGAKWGADHVAVIQDDVTVCRDFHRSLTRVARELPDSVVALYANCKEVETDYARQQRWTPVKGVWGQGIMLPARLIEEFITWSDTQWVHPDGALPGAYYDSRMGAWARAAKVPMAAVVPSLVEHLAPSESLLGYNNRTRVARHFIGEQVSGLSVWR